MKHTINIVLIIFSICLISTSCTKTDLDDFDSPKNEVLQTVGADGDVIENPDDD